MSRRATRTRRFCRTRHADGSTTYFHATLAGVVELITNADGASKQDCELNAMHRALPRRVGDVELPQERNWVPNDN